MLPHYLSRCSDIKIPGHISIGPRYLDVRALVLLLPRLIEVAQPELNVANDVDSFSMLDESLCRRIYVHSLDAGVAVEHIPAVPRAGPRGFGTARLVSRYSVWTMRFTWRTARGRPDFRPSCCRLAGCGTRFLRGPASTTPR